MNNTLNKDVVSLLPLGGLEDVTKNMYLYEYKDEILIIDCGIGFADSSMLGVDLLLPDISYLLENCFPLDKAKKKIVGMVLTHGHEDHIGAIPYLLPQLPQMPVFASPFTAAMSNEKLKEFRLPANVEAVSFEDKPFKVGSFTIELIRVTHSVPDSANIFIKTPIGNFYHGSDFKVDFTPHDKKRMDFEKIIEASKQGILAMTTDSLGSDRAGHTPTEDGLTEKFERIIENTKGKLLVTTYSSNVARLNQIIEAAEKFNKKVCFVGRSLIKVSDLAYRMGYLKVEDTTIVEIDKLKNYPDDKLVLMVAGSQGQENSALTRIAEGEHKDIKLRPEDTVVFSSDPIPGNEEPVNQLTDSLLKTGAQVVASGNGQFYHVSGHASIDDHLLMMSLLKPKFIVPISGNYKHLAYYQKIASKMGYDAKQVPILENGQELLFAQSGIKYGRKIDIKNVYVDQVSGEEIEGFVLRDRERLAKDGIIILMIEVNANNGQLVGRLDVIARGFKPVDSEILTSLLNREVKEHLGNKTGKVGSWTHLRKQIEALANKAVFKKIRRRPLIMPIIIEV